MKYFVSYPKSGRTWVRFMLNTYLCRLRGLDTANVFEVEETSAADYPCKWIHLSAVMLAKMPYYAMGRMDGKAMVGSTCVLLTRQFHATLASAYHQAVNRIEVFSGNPSDFLRDPRFGAIKLVTFYNLWHHLEPHMARSAVISYDRMLEDPQPEFRRVLETFDLPIDENLVRQAVEASSFQNMKRLGTTPAYAGTVLAPKDAADPDSAKVRVGGDSGCRRLFTEDDLAYIDRVAEDILVGREDPRLAGCWRRPQAPIAVG